MQQKTMEEKTGDIIRRIETGEPVVAYLAHPYEGGNMNEKTFEDHKKNNFQHCTRIMKDISDKWRNVAIIHPLANFDPIADILPVPEIMEMEKSILKKVDVLILSGDYHNSAGCMEEWTLAYYAYHIPCLRYDDDLRVLFPVFGY